MGALLRPVTGNRRRRTAVVALTPAVAAAFLAASGLDGGTITVPWLLLVAVAATLSAAVLATYVPERGLRPDFGCTPCAAVSAMTVVGAAIALDSYGASLVGPAVAIAATLFGLTQRLGQPDACAR